MNIINYFKASLAEMKQVTWPTKKETYNYALLVIGISLALMVFLGLLDTGFSWGLEQIINK